MSTFTTYGFKGFNFNKKDDLLNMRPGFLPCWICVDFAFPKELYIFREKIWISRMNQTWKRNG